MIYGTLQSDIDAYFQSDAISNSKLKLILKGMEEYGKEEWEEKKLYYEEKGFMIIGSGVDCLLTQGKEGFKEQFYVSTADKPSGKGLSVIMYLYDRVKENYDNQDIVQLSFSNLTQEDIALACEAEDYYANRSITSKIKEISKNEDFFNELTGSHGKQIISYEDYILIENIVKSLRNNPVTARYFPEDNDVHAELSGNQVDIYYQVPFYFTYQGIDAKALLDMIVVDHELKTIIPMDLKTMGGYTSQFMYQAMRMRYDIQAAWYSLAIASVDLSTILPTVGNPEEYEIMPFKFIVESTKVQGKPMIYTCNQDFIQMGAEGRLEGIVDMWSVGNNVGVYDISNKMYHSEIKGYNKAFELYLWHEENGYEFDRDYVESGGQFVLDWNRKEPVKNEV